MKLDIAPFAFPLILLAVSPSCERSRTDNPTAAPVEEAKEPVGLTEEIHDDSGAASPSDLDRTLDDLLGLTCEHEKATFECDECRYEVGFVRAPVCLKEGGLITTVTVERQKVAVPIVLTGEIRFDERRVAEVNSQAEGIVKKVHVALGDRVKKGQPLVEIESVLVGEAQAASLEAQGLLAVARRNFERAADLRKENISSEKEFLSVKQEFEAAEIRAQGALEKLARLGADTATRGRSVLQAPMNGSVLAMHAVAGETAKSDKSLVTIGDSDAVSVWADLHERDIASVKKGQTAQNLPASVSVRAYPKEDFPGIVDLVSPAMDESSRTAKVRVRVKNPDGRLLSGMFATVKIFLPGSDDALALPRAALMEDEGRSFVFIHHQGEYYVRRPVVVGRFWPGWVEVKEGLGQGQTVVAEGAFLMKSDVLRSKMGAGCAD